MKKFNFEVTFYVSCKAGSIGEAKKMVYDEAYAEFQGKEIDALQFRCVNMTVEDCEIEAKRREQNDKV